MIIIQYSYLLLVAVYLYKTLVRSEVRVISDCHTKALRRGLSGRGKRVFAYLKKKSFECVDLCLIANEGQKADALKYTDRIQVIPDPIPPMAPQGKIKGRGHSVVFVCSFDDDEPVSEILDAAEALSRDRNVYITGRAAPSVRERVEPLPRVLLTGFVSEGEYNQLIGDAGCLVSCTTEEGCLQSSGYEAIAVETPFVTTDSRALRAYFRDAAVYVDNDSGSIRSGVHRALECGGDLRKRMRRLKRQREGEMNQAMNTLEAFIQNGCEPSASTAEPT
ncbi:glycosyltransferase [Marinimicrobium locisalis]|uniref:glycosyltransferase n=1 Tax=Marinimicrobium locisalis TaxID=546022 RepID=UPI0032222229